MISSLGFVFLFSFSFSFILSTQDFTSLESRALSAELFSNLTSTCHSKPLANGFWEITFEYHLSTVLADVKELLISFCPHAVNQLMKFSPQTHIFVMNAKDLKLLTVFERNEFFILISMPSSLSSFFITLNIGKALATRPICIKQKTWYVVMKRGMVYPSVGLIQGPICP
jgi:hypothetical protein